MSISSHTDNPIGPLAEALLREHHEIDAGIETFASKAGAEDRPTDTDASLIEWAEPLTDAMRALRRHIYLEEVIVFPKIRMGALMVAVMVMIREHGEIWRAMDKLDAKLTAITDAQSVSDTDRASLVEDCRNMLALLDDHNMKEEPVIYPHLDTDLDQPTEQLLSRFLQEGELPAEWVCEALQP